MNERYYLIKEEELLELLAAALRLEALECGGVDNWEWYGESLYDFKEHWIKVQLANKNITSEQADEIDYYDIANNDLKHYSLYTGEIYEQ